MKRILTALGLMIMVGCAAATPKVETAGDQLREKRLTELNTFMEQEEQHLMDFLSMQMGQFVFLVKDQQVVSAANNLAIVPFNIIVSHRQVAKIFVLVTYGENGLWRIINIVVDKPQVIGEEGDHGHQF